MRPLPSPFTSIALTFSAIVLIATLAIVAGSQTGNAGAIDQATHSAVAHIDGEPTDGRASQAAGIPASGADAAARVAASPRRAEWRIIKVGATDSVIAWVVFPQSTARAPVVVVIHENMGLNIWTRGVADQLAADGFIAIAPDLITMKRTGDLKAEWAPGTGGPAISSLTDAEVRASLKAVAAYGLALPNAGPKYGIVGYCWGGQRSFAHGIYSPTLGASVVYYGSPPPADSMAAIRAPVLGLYGGNDARITANVPATDSAMKSRNKVYEPHVFPGAAHGFLRQQEAAGGPNFEASKAAWPLTVAWFKKHMSN